MSPFVVVLPAEPAIAEPRIEQAKTAEASKSEPKESETEGNSNPEPSLKYKTWMLKVSIHCEGCKRKVKRILSSIDGVYETNIELKQQKVTVIGNVDAGTLIKRLERAGKHAELWVENSKDKKGMSNEPEKDKQKEPDIESEVESEEEDGNDVASEKAPLIKERRAGNISKVADGNGSGVKAGKSKEVRIDPKPTVVTFEANSPLPAAGVAEADGSTAKRKKKKGRKARGGGDNGGETMQQSYNDTPSTVQVPLPDCHPAGTGPPSHHVFQFPATQFAGPVYTVNYSSAPFPGPRLGAAYYYIPEYVCHDSSEPSLSERREHSPGREHSPVSFHMLSDENPNACSVM